MPLPASTNTATNWPRLVPLTTSTKAEPRQKAMPTLNASTATRTLLVKTWLANWADGCAE